MEKEDRLNKIYRRGKDIVIGLALLGTMGLCTHRISENYSGISKEKFDGSKWYSSTTIPYNAYSFEKIPHNTVTYADYLNAVKKKNGSLENATLFPDLDGNGKVAK
jgi:hypothetical protein